MLRAGIENALARANVTADNNRMKSRIWFAVFIGSTIGGFVPALWGGEMLSYSGVFFSGAGALLGLWIASRMD